MPNIGPLEITVVLIIALLVLGPKRLPEAGRAAGRGIREFKNAITGGGDSQPEALALSAPEAAAGATQTAAAKPRHPAEGV
ncbi:MAG: twin-arginine translocase TatA/TatE family subunit [Thermoleophilaceae bacterium]|nr:twin-arginine translocase TatA/TatE family subunit [Thermoleophilaceae bacterium]